MSAPNVGPRSHNRQCVNVKEVSDKKLVQWFNDQNTRNRDRPKIYEEIKLREKEANKTLI